jgi:hypothetical protein
MFFQGNFRYKEVSRGHVRGAPFRGNRMEISAGRLGQDGDSDIMSAACAN